VGGGDSGERGLWGGEFSRQLSFVIDLIGLDFEFRYCE